MAKTNHSDQNQDARYEFRVWGDHKKARKRLASLATESSTEEVVDCYFLVDESGINAKVRDDQLKVKQLVERTRGFERWESTRYGDADDAPAPFDDLFDDLRLDRPIRGKSYDLTKEVERLESEDTTPVFVSKRRTHYRIGRLRAEVTDITIQSTGEVLHTLAIEGGDLDELAALRKSLGLKGTENVAVHVALSDER